MSIFGGGPKTPPVETPKPPPQLNDPAIEDARRREQEAARKAKGRSSTMLTGGLGVTAAAPVARPTLLGSR